MQIKRVLVCGMGSIGRRHIRILTSLYPQIEVSTLRSGHGAICSEENLVTNQFYSESEALAWSPDAVLVASPAPYHTFETPPEVK